MSTKLILKPFVYITQEFINIIERLEGIEKYEIQCSMTPPYTKDTLQNMRNDEIEFTPMNI